jgi:hypothetical protein
VSKSEIISEATQDSCAVVGYQCGGEKDTYWQKAERAISLFIGHLRKKGLTIRETDPWKPFVEGMEDDEGGDPILVWFSEPIHGSKCHVLTPGKAPTVAGRFLSDIPQKPVLYTYIVRPS